MRIRILIRATQKTYMIINRIYNFVILKNFSCKKRGTQPHKSAQEDPFKKFIELYNAQRTIIKRYLGSLRPKIFSSENNSLFMLGCVLSLDSLSYHCRPHNCWFAFYFFFFFTSSFRPPIVHDVSLSKRFYPTDLRL